MSEEKRFHTKLEGALGQRATEPPQVEIIRPTRRVGALLGFLLKVEVDARFKQEPFEPVDKNTPAELWRTYDQKRQQLETVSAGEIEPLPEELHSTIEKLRSRKTFREHYETVADYSFAFALIDSLLAPQWYADLDYVDDIRKNLSVEMSTHDQLLFAMSEGKITEPIVTQNQVYFTSPRRDLYASPIPEVRETKDGEFEIVVRAASRPNYIQVAQLGNRLLLTNGVHKVCALSKAGFKRCVCLTRTVHNLEETGLDPRSTSLFRPAIFESQRPAMVKDFLSPDTAAPLRMRSTYQVLQVSVGVGAISVPALPEPRNARKPRTE